MNPSDCTTINTLRNGIEKLFHVQNMATYLSCQLGEAIATITGAFKQDTTESPEDMTYPGVNLTTAELLELMNLEDTRQAIMGSWKYIEQRKANIIRAAKVRDEQGGGQ